MPQAISQKVEFSGPFFERDPGATLRGNIQRMMEAVAREGEQAVRAALAIGESDRIVISHHVEPDRVSGHAIGRVTSLASKHWLATAVISVNNSGFSPAEGKSLMAAASAVEGETHAFRRTATALRRSRAVLRANLTAGIE